MSSLDISLTTDIAVAIDRLAAKIDTLNTHMETLVDYVQEIKNQMTRLADGQAQQTEALATQLEAIVAEMQQFNAEDITQAQLDNLLASVTAAADKAHQLAADTQTNTQEVMKIVPDTPPA